MNKEDDSLLGRAVINYNISVFLYRSLKKDDDE
jgi:hypothetical protein